MRQPKFFGVHSLSTGWTDDRRKTLFFVWELPDGAYAVQELDPALQPQAAPERISARAFSKNFRAEPDILAMPMSAPDPAGRGRPPSLRVREAPDLHTATPNPAANQQNKPDGLQGVPTAPRPQAATKLTVHAVTPPPAASTAQPAAQVSFQDASRAANTGARHATSSVQAFDLQSAHQAKLAEDNLRETFRQTLLRLKRPKEHKAALAALEQLAHTTKNITPVHKHMFRDFGVRLRQSSLPDLALLFSRKAVELAPEDDHAHFNLARILCLLGQYDEAADHIRTAMHMDSQEPVYFRMLAHIRKEKLLRRGAQSAPTFR